MLVSGTRDECLLREARKCLGEEVCLVHRAVLERIGSARLKMAQQRGELAELRRSLADTDARVTRLSQSLSDDVCQLHSELDVEFFLDHVIDKLVQHGRAIRLVVCHVDPSSAGDPRPSSLPGHRGQAAGQHTARPHRSGETFSFHPRLIHDLLFSLSLQ